MTAVMLASDKHVKWQCKFVQCLLHSVLYDSAWLPFCLLALKEQVFAKFAHHH